LDKDIPIAKKIVKTKIIILTKFKGEHLKANMIAARSGVRVGSVDVSSFVRS
jgi:hypothetical protein